MKEEDFFGKVKPKNKYSSPTMTILMGAAGVGKTTLAASASELGFTVLFNFENRIGHIEETEDLRFIPRSLGEFRKDKLCSYTGLTEGLKKIKGLDNMPRYVIMDTLDAMFDVILEYNKSIKGSDYGAHYDATYKEMNKIFSELKQCGCNVILTTHTSIDPVLNKLTISVKEKIRNSLNKQTDNIFYYYVLANESRILQMKTSDVALCKLGSITGKENNKVAPRELTDPDWRDVEKVLNGGNNDESESTIGTYDTDSDSDNMPGI